MMCRTERHPIFDLVAAAARAVNDVVLVLRRSATARDAAKAVVPIEDLMARLRSRTFLQVFAPDIHEVVSNERQALAGGCEE